MGNSLCGANASVGPDEAGLIDDEVGVGVMKINTFKVFYSDNRSIMTTIAPMSDNEAWIANSQKSSIKLYTTGNKEIGRKQLEGGGTFAMLSSGDHIITGFHGTLLRVAADGKVTTLMIPSQSPLVSSGVFYSSTQTLRWRIKIPTSVLPISQVQQQVT